MPPPPACPLRQPLLGMPRPTHLLCLAALLLAGCHSKVSQPGLSSNPPRAGQASSAPPSPATALHGIRWLLTRVGTRPIAAGPQAPYLQLLTEEPRAEGLGGCNRFSGEYFLSAPDRLRFGAMLHTEMACPELATEASFFNALLATRRYALRADSLRLYDSLTTTPLAVFRAGP